MIYLDANATSRLRPEAGAVLAEFLGDDAPRNASSVHAFGRTARSRLQSARRSIVRLLNLGTEDRTQRLVFTSGATEACNQMMLGFLGPLDRVVQNPATLVLSAIEHPAVLEPATLLERCGWKLKKIRPNQSGVIDLETFTAAVDETTALVSLMAANNETGIIQPVAETARALRSRGFGGPIVCDFTQAFGKSLISASSLFEAGVTALAISGHKLGAPTGIGALVFSEAPSAACFVLEPMLRGGAQEQGLRGGTENTIGAIAFGEVCRLRCEQLPQQIEQTRKKRELLWTLLEEALPDIERLNDANNSLCNTLAVRFRGCRGDDLVVACDLAGVAFSTGSACASGKQSVSHVVTAMGFEPNEAREVVRFSLDWDTSDSDVRSAAEIIAGRVNEMRERIGGTVEPEAEAAR